jgi:hypothetical protein
MRKFIPVLALAGVAALGGVVLLGAAPPTQDEPKQDKQLKTLLERVDKLDKRVVELEKRVAVLEKKLTERAAGGGKWEDGLKGLLDKFEGGEGFRKMFDDLRKSMPEMPEMPDLDTLPDFFQGFEGMEMDQLFDMLKAQLEGQMPEFFEQLDMDGLFDQFKDKLERSVPKEKGPKRRSI